MVGQAEPSGPRELQLTGFTQSQGGDTKEPENENSSEDGDSKPHEKGNSTEDAISKDAKNTSSPQVEASMITEDQKFTVANINVNSLSRDSEETEKGNSSEEALRKRVQSFIEGLVKMASPVLLALKMNKVDLRSKGNAFIRGSISPLAAAILEFSIILFLWLWLCSSQLLKDNKRKFMYTVSKMLVHLCGVLLMWLASCILLLIIAMDGKFCLLLLVPFLCITLLSSATSAMRSEDDDASLHEEVKCEDELERSVDFTASITTLVFLGLGRFAFEVDDPQKADVSEHLSVAAIISFVICMLGVFFTLYGTIPLLPSINALKDMEDDKAQEHVREKLELSSMLLAATVLGVVTWITWVIMKLWACLLTIPLLASLFAGIYKDIIKQLQNSEPKKPQSGQDPARVNPAQPQGVVEGQRKPQPARSGETSAEQTTATSIAQPQPAGTGSRSGETRSTTLELHSTSSGESKPANHLRASSEVTSAGQTSGTGTSSVETRPASSDEHPGTSSIGEARPAQDETTTATSAAQPQLETTGRRERETKAAPLELTKATFTAFLLVAIPSFGDSSIHGYTHAFIFLTAAALVSGLLSRLLTHRTNPSQAVVRAANVSSFFAHSCLAAAVVPFTLMAIRAQTVPPSSPHTCAGTANTTNS